DPEPEPDAKRPSKQGEVIAMLRRPEGATVDEVASAMGWQRHTVRGLFSGTLKKNSGSRSPRRKRSAAGSTASPNRQAHETASPRHFGPPTLWRAVLRSRSKREPEGRPAGRRCDRGRRPNCRIGAPIDARTAPCLAPIASCHTAPRAQSRSADPSPRPPAARAELWRNRPGIAAPPAGADQRARKARRALRSRRRAEDGHDIGPSVAWAHPRRIRSRERAGV